jgi:hypothetical protein
MRACVFAGCVAALAGLAAAQTSTTTGDPSEQTPDPNNPDGEDPCAGPDPPWFCNPTAYQPGGTPSVKAYTDEETGFTYAQYDAAYTSDESRIYYRVAVPKSVPANAPYDTVIQMQAPNNVGWAALSWGGEMVNSPLIVAWANCSNVVVTPRFTTTRVLPPNWSGATLQMLEVGTFVNDTHWQFTAKCTGCTSWVDPQDGPKWLDPTGTYKIAWAFANLPPSNAASKNSTFSFHDVYGYFDHDLSLGNNDNFKQLVTVDAKLPTPTPTADACIFTWTPPAGAIVVTTTTTVALTTVTKTVTVTQPPLITAF